MRIDHHAYQRGTRVAGVGLLTQLGLGLTLLIFSLVGGETVPQDTALLFGSLYILLGGLAWLGLVVIFNQHKLERLEALEEDELAASRGSDSMFEDADEEIRVAARRLRLMHKWLMPATSLLIAAGLGVLAWRMFRQMSLLKAGEAEFHLTTHTGWAVSICLAFSALAFIMSRFVAGMAMQPAWQNLRGGAAYMVGNSLVTLALAIGIGFRFFKNDEVMTAIAYAIPIIMVVVASEIVLNLVLNSYRPRIPGEVPRPAFDSRLLSLFAAPDNLVRSINEAVNYQFGFDITSSWGYQLLIRSFAWLAGVGFVTLLGLNMLVIVEPHQQAIKLARGQLVGDVHRSGVMLKLPWPLQTAEVFDVSTIRELHLTGKQVVEPVIQLWTDELGRKFDRPLEPFLVGASTLESSDFAAARDAERTLDLVGNDKRDEAEDDSGTLGRDAISAAFSLIDSEIVLQYRIREDGGLLDYLDFATPEQSRYYGLTVRERALASLASRAISQRLATLSIDDVLTSERLVLGETLRGDVQLAFDDNRTGVDLVSVDLPLLRPSGTAAAGFEELSISYQARQQHIANAEQKVVAGLSQLIGDADRAATILEELTAFDALVDELGVDSPEVVAQRVALEQMLVESGGLAAEIIAQAERDRWVRLMHTQAEAARLQGQIVSYRAAPRLFRERATMMVYATALPDLYKYVLCVDPSRVEFNIDVTELNAMFGFGDAFDQSAGETPK